MAAKVVSVRAMAIITNTNIDAVMESFIFGVFIPCNKTLMYIKS